MSSRNRGKRSRTPSVETSSSFVKNVTSRVSGLLPTTITNWFSNPSPSSANGSAPTADPTDSSTDDETLESVPSKRVRFNQTGTTINSNSFFAGQDVNSAPPDILDQSIPFNVVQSPPNQSTFRRDPPNYVSTPLTAKELSAVERGEDSSMFKNHTVSSIGPSVATKRKSLFDSESSDASIRACTKTSCNTMTDPNQPSFKASLLASPFYPGRTMYGGASASYMNKANMKQKKNTIVNNPSTPADNSISHSTRRVMDLLEQYSSPLNDAKRIPPYLTTSASGSSVGTPNSLGQSQKLPSYKTQELYVPSIASVLRLKRRGRLMDTTAAARQIIASHSSTSDHHEFIPKKKPYDHVERSSDPQRNLTSKVKPKLKRPSRRKSSDVIEEMPSLEFQPPVVLHIDQDKLPKFSFEPAMTTASGSVYKVTETTTEFTETKKLTTIIETETSKCKPNAVSISPVRISSDAVNHDSQLPKFTFRSPERQLEKSNESTVDTCVVGPKESTEKEKDWKCSDCWVSNKSDVDKCVCCGGKKPSSDTEKPKKCSICKLSDSQAKGDKCVNCEKITTNNIGKPLATKTDDSSKWKCEDCWVSNEEAAEKCVCCGASNPKKPAAKPVTSEADGDWKCDDCWIKNKGSVDKCAACGGAKPGAKTAKQNAFAATPTTTFKFGIKPAADNKLNDIVKSQAGKWECLDCLVRNDADKTKCACCESDKPATVNEPEKKFNFGVNTSFKFGINPTLQEAQKLTETRSEENKLKAFTAETKKEEQSETNNNVLPKTPLFSFGVPAKKAEDLLDEAKIDKEKLDTAPKLNFSFRVPTSMPAPVAKSPETKVSEEEKPQEVPTVTFTLPKPKEAPKTVPSFTFGTPVSQAAAQDKPATTPAPVLGTKLESKETPANPLVLPTPSQPAQSTTTAPTQPAFTFGSMKPLPNLFAPAVTTSSTPVVFGAAVTTASQPITFGAPTPAPATTAATMPLFQSPTTTVASLSIFQKPESSTTSSLFQKTEAAVTTTAAPAPLFSFGSNAQAAATEKPKFNFTFGSNKTESTPIFGAPNDSSSNKFTGNALGAGSGLGSTTGGNGLTGNALGNTLGGNGLGVASGLGANPMSNALGGSGLTNSITGGALGNNSLPTNPLGSSSEPSNPMGGNLQTPSMSGGIFGSAMPKENIWSSNNSNSNVVNPFVSNTTANTNSLQKPAAFTFGSPTPFNASGGSPAFGGAQTVPNVFGIGSQPSNQGTLFCSTPASSVFGSPASSTPVMFGSHVNAAPAFGAANPSTATFEAPRPVSAFNFSPQQQPNAVFGFGQSQQPQQAPGVYNFGATGASQVQFNMGSSPGTAVRRVRKAVRKNTPR